VTRLALEPYKKHHDEHWPESFPSLLDFLLNTETLVIGRSTSPAMETSLGLAVDAIAFAVLDLPNLRKESSWGMPERRRQARLPRRRE
jgi:hypothetical protein